MPLILHPDPVLRKQSKRVVLFDDRLRRLAQGMGKVMLQHNGLGISAPQIGVLSRVVIVWDGTTDTRPEVLVNPEIVSSSPEDQTGLEGCLSFPDQFLEITRSQKVTVRYQTLKGKVTTLKASGLLARCVAHECDHLDGVLFTDRKTAGITTI